MSISASFISGAFIIGKPATVYYQGIAEIWGSKK
jgi:hypothetical protein